MESGSLKAKRNDKNIRWCHIVFNNCMSKISTVIYRCSIGNNAGTYFCW